MKKINIKQSLISLAPFFGLILLIIIYFLLGNYKEINITYGMKSILNQSVVVAIVATGAIFIYTLGSFDISLGAY